MAPAIRSTGRRSLQGSFDRDVYIVLKKLEETSNDNQPFKSVHQAYEAIKKSNSALSRQKKQPLENAIDRVIQFRRNDELEEDSDSEAEIEAEEAKAYKEDDRFLLNRQLTKHWNTSTTSSEQAPPAKKRRLIDVERKTDKEDDAVSDKAPKKVNGTASSEAPTADKHAQQKKHARSPRFTVEQEIEECKLGGMSEMTNLLRDSLRGLMNFTAYYDDSGLKKASGILISGPRGSGKKSLIRTLASKLNLPLISISQCFDDPERIEKNLAEAFDQAIKLAPSIILVEQLDQYMSKADRAAPGENRRQIISQFTRQMQRIPNEVPRGRHVLAVATTSRIVEIDPVVLERGLFESTFYVQVPDCEMRKEIIEILIGEVAMSEDLDISNLARLTNGYVGRDLDHIVAMAGDSATTRVIDEQLKNLNGGIIPTEDEKYELERQLRKEMNSTQPIALVSLTLSDFHTAMKDFTPSLRKEGFTAIPDVTWDSVGALSAVRQQLQTSIIGPIKHPELYQTYGVTLPAGVLLWGPPGCGKTLIAQAVANDAQASFILISGPELLNKYVGESERAVRELFQRARSSTPCILFFDEIDSLVPNRDSSSNESGTRVVNAFLTELDGARNRTGIYVIGTTNRPGMIDEAMLRPGRLSARLFLDLPTPEERVDILKTVYKRAHYPRNVSDLEISMLDTVARDKRCDNFSGADLEGLRIKAALHALSHHLSEGETAVPDENKIGQVDWEYALANTRQSVLDPESYRRMNRKMSAAA